EVGEYPEDQPTPEQVLAEEEAEVKDPARAQEPLAALGREGQFQRPKDDYQEEEAEAGGNGQCGQRHRLTVVMFVASPRPVGKSHPVTVISAGRPHSARTRASVRRQAATAGSAGRSTSSRR